MPLGEFFYHDNHLGSSVLITDKNGKEKTRILYKPFGEIDQSHSVGLNATTMKFTSQELDEETELYYYGARYYDPSLGRFLNPDSIVPDPYDSQSYNRYAYALGNPIRYTDPTGHYVQDYNGTTIGADFVTDADKNNEYNSCSSWCNGSIERDGLLTGTWNTLKNWFQNQEVRQYNHFLGASLKSYYDLEKLRAQIPEIDNIYEGLVSAGIAQPWEMPEFQVLMTLANIRMGGRIMMSNQLMNNYSVSFQMTLRKGSYPGVSRARHFQEANEALLQAMQKDPSLAKQMKALGVSITRGARGAAPRKSPSGWTWHHDNKQGLLQLVLFR